MVLTKIKCSLKGKILMNWNDEMNDIMFLKMQGKQQVEQLFVEH
jgi:hypothetical protein